MIRRRISFMVVCFALILGGCSIDDEPNFHFTVLGITSAELPESFDFDETYQINFTYVLPDGCTFYERPDVTRENDSIRNVVAIGLTRTDVEICTQATIEGESSFDFKVIYTEPYTFRFYQGENSDGEAEFLEVVVPVN